MNTATPRTIHFIAIAMLALSMIVVQILISRVLSVMVYYHFAFAGVTFAMLGLAAGALRVHMNPDRFHVGSINRECAIHSLRAAILLVLGTVILAELPGVADSLTQGMEGHAFEAAGALIILAGMLCYILAFVALGVCVTMLLTFFPQHTNRLYAADLMSAAAGCFFTLVCLFYLDPISIMLILATALAALAWRLSGEERADGSGRSVKLVVTMVFGLMLAVQGVSYASGAPLLKIRMAKFEMISNLLFERWNSYSHVAIYPNKEHEPFGWGFGDNLDTSQYDDVEQYWLKIDGNAGTVLTRFSGDFDKVGYLKYDVTTLGYHLRAPEHVAIIGVGGGRDVLSALTFGTKQVTGVEINPAIFEALNHSFVDYTGNLGSYPGMSLVNAEARSYISSQPDSYDMIQISLIDTWAATAAGGLTLSENRLYTVEAWKEFMQHLNDDGVLAVSRWFASDKHEGELYRLLSLASDALGPMLDGSTVEDHLIAVESNNVVTVLLSKSPFTAAQLAKLGEVSEVYGFHPLIVPGEKGYNEVTHTLLTGGATNAFYASLPMDVTAPTDDRPFFFNMARLSNALSSEAGGDVANNMAIYILFVLSLVVFVYLGYAVLRPMVRLYRSHHKQFAGSGPFILYFSCIGLGFMFIEMSLMQWLMIFLGHPVYALSVVLFTMLLFSGIGSYLVNYRKLSPATYILRPLMLCVVLALTLWVIKSYRDVFVQNETDMRILLSILLLVPLSLFLGMMFPLGVAAAKQEHDALLPWFWGLNGAASVFASIFSVVLSMNYGASATYAAGIACYVLCLLACLNLRKAVG